MAAIASDQARQLINLERLQAELDRSDLDAVVAVSPENTHYLSGAWIRTQVSIRDRLALLVWPVLGEPTFVVCNIEESLAERESWIKDVRTYVEFAQSPVNLLLEVLREKGLEGGRIGIERRFLTAEYHQELIEGMRADYQAADHLLERVRAVKTPGEVSLIRDAFFKTEAAIRAAWAGSRAGDSERVIAQRMVDELTRQGADGVRHITLASGENTIHAHRRPGDRQLGPGDLLLTDIGGNWGGFNSDMARMGVCGDPTPESAAEFSSYREAYVDTLQYLRPGVTAASVFHYCARAFGDRGIDLTSPHIGHSVSRGGGHENPILHPFNEQRLEPGMLIALEPTFRPNDTRRYHLEDLVLITPNGADIITDWESTAQMIRITT
ncbi:MAG: aminopeptidase P family protein [Candidatus Dormibacteraeota bacterium]|uniref:Aminopeptidase P family protein n=1 Tax=Candidatus Dormiibacter inghamiae TaxID=3127013 RepID=A0A934KGR1_9BACT|nr:aminopeptidase P family protein [Candidatus Dormibacteraeota bacterium]MBJ7605268.1 aminopeptidase P family protein [Candidatus Dormibacteraeota bacterium]